MITVIEAQEFIRQKTAPLAAETVPLAQAQGRVLAEPVAASEDMPPFDRSAMDGYAVRMDDNAHEFAVVGEIRAGQVIEAQLKPGQAMRIFTGAQLPGPGLKVILQEHVEAQDGRIRVQQPSHGSNVRQRGEDAKAGEILLEPAITLDATALALLASVGQTSVRVVSQPKILHLTTGDEIVPPEQTPAPGQIRNSNASLIAGLCREQGIEVVTHYHAPDDLPALLKIFSDAKAGTYDMILISGGSGQGTYDFSGELFQHLGAEIHFRAVNVRPGKPLIFGTVARREGVEPRSQTPFGNAIVGAIQLPHDVPPQGSAMELPQQGCSQMEFRNKEGRSSSPPETPMGVSVSQDDGLAKEGATRRPQIIFGLPGNALSHFVCFHLFVRLALDRLLARPGATATHVFLANDLTGALNTRETWWPAQARLKKGRLECRALPWKSSGDITRLPAANALLHVPSSTSHLPAGTMVELLLTRNLEITHDILS